MKVAVVAATCVERDAISAAAASHAVLAARHPRVERVDVFAEHIDRRLDVAGHTVRDAWQLLRHPRFRDADVAIFHWGIEYALFDALTVLGEIGPAPVITFHNMTPEELVDEPLRSKLAASRVQLAHGLSLGTTLWTYSEENHRALRAGGVAAHRIRFVPFPIEAPRQLEDRRSRPPIRLLSIGRLMRAKGADVLIEAIGELAATTDEPFTLELVANLAFSYSDFVERLERRIDELGLRDTVQIATDVDDDGLWDRLERAHVVVVPSLHEGLCVPVIEAYLAGCRVVASDAGNLRYLVTAPDRVVPAGDATALASALAPALAEVRSGRDLERPAADAICRLYSGESARHAFEMALDELADPAGAVSQPWPAMLAGAVPAG